MAKAESDGRIPKRIGNLSFYTLEGEIIVRHVSGFTADALLKSAKYELSRKNATEFGHVSSSCKLLRTALKDLLPKTNNLAIVNAFTKKMRQILEYDVVHVRGERTLASALKNESAIAALSGYNFNPDYEQQVLYELKGKELKVCLPEIVFPEQSNCIGFRVSELEFDFATLSSRLVCGDWLFYGIESLPQNVDFLVSDDKQLLQFKFVLLEMQFHDAAHGSFLPLVNDRSKAVVLLG